MRLRYIFLPAVLLAAVVLVPTASFGAPANPRFAYASAPKANEVLINWEPLSSYTGTVRYHVYRATSSAGPYSEIGVAEGVYDCSYIDTGGATPLESLRRYWYRIAAEDGTGLNTTPQYMSGTPTGVTAEALMSPTTGPPVEPRGLEATASVTGSSVGSITVSWQPVTAPNVVRYDVYRLEQSGDDGVLVGSTTATSYVDTGGLVVERHYWYRVAAVAQYGATTQAGPKSFEVYIRPMSDEVVDVPHSGGSPDGDSCLRCHDIHAAATDPLLWMDAGSDQAFCLSCHDGTGSKYDINADFVDTAAKSRHPVDAGTHSGGDLICTECHSPHGDPEGGDYKLLDAYGETGTIEYCLTCHQPGTQDPSAYSERTHDMTSYRLSEHNASGVADPPSGTGIKCRTCHLPHSSPNEDLLMYAEYRACLNCHSSEQGGSIGSSDIYARITASEELDAHHDVLHRDQDRPGAGRMACQNCHNSHASRAATPCVDPYDPAPWNPYPKTVQAEFSAITGKWRNSFCFECHDNSLPGSADTTPWVDPPVWSDPLGDGAGTSDLENVTSMWTSQNHGTRSTNNEDVWPDVTAQFGANPELECVDCHEPHGAVNTQNLRSDILSREGLKVVELEDVNPTLSGYDSRFWCMGCHQSAQSTHTSGGKSWTTFPKDCSRGGTCHGHQNSGGQF